LVVMIPHIIETPDDLRKVHERRMRERQAFLERETGFKKRDLETAVNYETKSGMLSTVDRQARKLEREEVALRQAEDELAQESLSGMIGLGVSQSGGDDDDSSGTGTPSRASKAKTVKTTKPKGRP
jgi:general secretion pathway protein D